MFFYKFRVHTRLQTYYSYYSCGVWGFVDMVPLNMTSFTLSSTIVFIINSFQFMLYIYIISCKSNIGYITYPFTALLCGHQHVEQLIWIWQQLMSYCGECNLTTDKPDKPLDNIKMRSASIYMVQLNLILRIIINSYYPQLGTCKGQLGGNTNESKQKNTASINQIKTKASVTVPRR